MLQDLIAIVKDFPKDTSVHLKPLGDLHVGSRQFSEERWEMWKKNLKPTDQIVIVGDMMDNGIKSSVSSTYDELMMPGAQKEWLYRELEPFADQILCGVGGNHERRSKRETDTDPLYDVFCRLHIEDRYRQNTAFVFIRIGKETSRPGSKKPTYVLCVTHGAGGGMYIGSSANKLERFGNSIDGVDLLISGHTHKPITFPSAKLVVDRPNLRIQQKQFTAVVCSSMMDYGGYPLEKLMGPTGQVEQEIILEPRDWKIRVIQG